MNYSYWSTYGGISAPVLIEVPCDVENFAKVQLSISRFEKTSCGSVPCVRLVLQKLASATFMIRYSYYNSILEHVYCSKLYPKCCFKINIKFVYGTFSRQYLKFSTSRKVVGMNYGHK